MTQILSVLTQDYVLLASDNLLTYGSGPRVGQVFADRECKLVSLCNTCGIGYTGLARLGGKPTHEWIALTLAESACNNPEQASQILAIKTPAALPNVAKNLMHQTFLIAGWAYFGEPPVMRPHFCLVSNAVDDQGQHVATPRSEFNVRVRALQDSERFIWYAIGQPLTTDRARSFERSLSRLISREVGPQETLRIMVSEVQNTSKSQQTVGEKILAFCIPRASVEPRNPNRGNMLIASTPTENVATFSYFDPTRDELLQYGPTTICGEYATTDLKTENDPSRDYQSAEIRFLHMPNKKL
jgi:hypothetical protein